MKARSLLPGVARATLYGFLAAAFLFVAAGASAAQAGSGISRRSWMTHNNGAGAAVLSIRKPAGVVSGDVMLAQIVVSLPGSTVSAPGGWHTIESTSAAGVKMVSYYHVATSSEPFFYRWSFSASQPATGGISDWIGVDATAPIDASSARVNSGSLAAFTQITTTAPNDLLLQMVGVAGNTTVTPPPNFVEQYDSRDTAAVHGREAELASKPKGWIGPTAVGSAREDSLSVANVTHLIALRPGVAVAGFTPSPTPAPVTIAAVGDMECITPTCQSVGAIGLVSGIKPAAFFPVGDLIYNGAYSSFVNYYGPSWGVFKPITHPVIGNHDGNQNYYSYWGKSAGPSGQGWYSLNIGAWHVVVLNSNCVAFTHWVSCQPGSSQINWLQSDLASHPSLCTVAFMHHPYYTSGATKYPELQTIFQTLYNYHVDLLVAGHTHYYQRFYPQNAIGQRFARGVAEIVVGTGGGTLANVPSRPTAPNEAAQIAQTFGVLRLTLSSSGYSFRFMPVPGSGATDSGGANCH